MRAAPASAAGAPRPPAIDPHDTTVRDVEQLGILAALASLGYVFWICGGMEMVERLAFYGVRQVAGLYATDARANGGLGLREHDLGIIFATWAAVQTFVPVFTGGLSDRFGYKETIAAATVFKIAGYLTMALLPSFWGFLGGAVVLAFGTAIFKPGLQGTIAKSTGRHNSSMAWGIFYQTVNIGGFIGPIMAASLRQLAWSHVFFACSAIISLNFLLLLTYREPDKAERLAHRARVRSGEITEPSLWRESARELARPIVLWYVLLFSGYWFMLNIFWDVGPLYFRDWVDTGALVRDVFGPDGTQNRALIFLLGLDHGGTRMLPEALVNLNAMLIMFVCFLVAGWSARLRAVSSLALGTLLAAVALLLFGLSSLVWVVVGGIMVFSLGEMLSSPKSSEYLGNIAPWDKKAMYLGFTQLPIGIGWTLEGYFGPWLYGEFSSKETLARRLLAEHGLDAAAIAAVPNGEAFAKLVELSGQPAAVLTAQLQATNPVGLVWTIMAIVGVASAAGLWVYGRWTYRLAESTTQE